MEITNKVIDIVKGLTPIDIISTSSSLVNDLNLDSLNMVALLINLETEFSFCLKEEDMNPYNLSTITDIINLVNKYKNNHDI